MGKITDIKPQKNKKRANIYIDGKYRCGMEMLTVVKNRLDIGREIDDEELERIQRDSESQTAFDKAAAYVSVRMRTEKEIKDYLLKKGYLTSVVHTVTDKLKEYGYADDEKFARYYLETSAAGKGELNIRAELKNHGIKSDVIEDVLEGYSGGEEEAVDFAVKYVSRYGFDRDKIIRRLASRGFKWDEIRQALDAAKQCADEDDDG